MLSSNSNVVKSATPSSRRIVVISTSAVVLLGSLYYLFYKKKLKDVANSMRSYFSPPPRPPNTTTSKNPNPNPEFTRKREAIENAFREKRNSHDHLLRSNSQLARVRRPAASTTRLNQLSAGSDNADNQLNQALESLKSAVSLWSEKDRSTFAPDKECEDELFHSLDVIIDGFDRIDVNRRKEASFELAELTKFEFFKSGFKLEKILSLLSSQFSTNNTDLFDNYKFNNTNGDVMTDVLIDLLEAVLNLFKSEARLQELKENRDLGEITCRLMHSYVVEFDKNKNNVRRIKRIQAIKLTSLQILNSVAKFYVGDVGGNGENFVRYMSEIDPMYLPEVKKSNSGRGGLGQDSNELILEAYIRLVGHYFGLISELKIEPSLCKTPLYGYLTGARFYVALDECFKWPHLGHLSESFDRIFKFLSSARRDEELDTNSRTSSTSEYEKISN